MTQLLYAIAFVVELAAWPFLAFAFCRYRLKLTRYRSYLVAITFVPVGLAVAIAFGDLGVSYTHSGESARTLWTVFYIIFLSPYVVLLTWLAVHLLHRSRRPAVTPEV